MAQARATTTEQVIDAATAVFLEKGFENSTISDIARAARISKPTIYQYVEGKQWLLDRIMALMCSAMEESALLVYQTKAPAAVRLCWMIQLHLELAVRYRNSYRVTLSEQSGLSPHAREEFRLWARRTSNQFADLLAECRREGAFDWPGDIGVAANLLMSTLNSTHRWFHVDSRTTEAMMLESVFRLISGVFQTPAMEAWPMPDIPLRFHQPRSVRDGEEPTHAMPHG